jgi:hypothetical protein
MKRGGGLPRARLGGAVKGDLLALGRPWEAAEVENVRCKHLVRGDCFRLTAGEWAHIWLAAFHDRAVFRVLPGSKLGAMLT